MHPAYKLHIQKGITLVEVLVVIAIAGILAMLAAPSFAEFMNNARQRTLQSQLFSDLNLARSEAIKRNARMLVCNANGNVCSASLDWASGWLVCYDANSDNLCDTGTTANPNPLIRRAGINSALTLTVSATPIRFNPTGTQGSSGAVMLTLAGSWSAAQTRTLSVSATGNVTR